MILRRLPECVQLRFHLWTSRTMALSVTRQTSRASGAVYTGPRGSCHGRLPCRPCLFLQISCQRVGLSGDVRKRKAKRRAGVRQFSWAELPAQRAWPKRFKHQADQPRSGPRYTREAIPSTPRRHYHRYDTIEAESCDVGCDATRILTGDHAFTLVHMGIGKPRQTLGIVGNKSASVVHYDRAI